jgi:hypothetical protein
MVFLADDFTAWLVAIMADAGRRKLSQVFNGTDEQGKALRSAAAAAIKATACELRPGDEMAAENLARVIDELFKVPTRDDVHDADASASQALVTSISAQFAVLDDACMTGVGQSAADSLEVSTAELTEKLYGHLRQQIVLLGSRGGPLAPLANELNHEATHRGLEQIADAIRQETDRLHAIEHGHWHRQTRFDAYTEFNSALFEALGVLEEARQRTSSSRKSANFDSLDDSYRTLCYTSNKVVLIGPEAMTFIVMRICTQYRIVKDMLMSLPPVSIEDVGWQEAVNELLELAALFCLAASNFLDVATPTDALHPNDELR